MKKVLYILYFWLVLILLIFADTLLVMTWIPPVDLRPEGWIASAYCVICFAYGWLNSIVFVPRFKFLRDKLRKRNQEVSA